MASTTPRLVSTPNNDNTGRVITQEYLTPTYASSIALTPSKQFTTVVIALTGACTLTANVNTPQIGDQLQLLLTADAGGARTLTLSTGFSFTASTIVCAASKHATVDFTYYAGAWVETGRSVEA